MNAEYRISIGIPSSFIIQNSVFDIFNLFNSLPAPPRGGNRTWLLLLDFRNRVRNF